MLHSIVPYTTMTKFIVGDKPYDCYIAFTLDLIGGKWKTLILSYRGFEVINVNLNSKDGMVKLLSRPIDP
jgi:hypothetical protein